MSAAPDTRTDRRSLQSAFVRFLGIDVRRRYEIYSDVAASATLRDGTYWLEILFSAGIATLGLTLDSPAVIIGAMLISPLMGPILAVGLALAAGDLLLALRAIANLLISAIVAVGFATLLVALLPFREMTAEIAARTHPNTLDLVIALFSGAIGSIATCKNVRGVATSIPGVAIAVALMPPLCVVGYGVGLAFTIDGVQGIAVVRGGGLLFLTNLVAITFTAMLVFLVLQIGNAAVRERVRGDEPAHPVVARGISAGLLRVGSLPGRLLLVTMLVASLVVPLSRSLNSLKQEMAQRRSESRLQKDVLHLWNETFARTSSGQARSYIDSVTATESDGRLSLQLRLFTNEPYSPEERTEFTRRLARILGRAPASIDLALIEIPTSQYDAARREKPQPEVVTPPPPPPSVAELIDSTRERIQQSIAAVHLPSPAILDRVTVALAGAETDLDVSYISPRDVDADAQALLRDAYRSALADAAIAVSFRRVDPVAEIRFQKNSLTPEAESLAALQAIADVVARHPEWSVSIRQPVRGPQQGDRLQGIRKQLAIDESRISTGEPRAGTDFEVSIVTAVPSAKMPATPAPGTE